jgi:hypothetical protein
MGPGSEAVDDRQVVELTEPKTSTPSAGEADISHLGGDKDPMLVEEPTEHSIPIGQSPQHIEQALVRISMTRRPWRPSL